LKKSISIKNQEIIDEEEEIMSKPASIIHQSISISEMENI